MLLGSYLTEAYSRISDGGERAEAPYEADVPAASVQDWRERFLKSRARDLIVRSTSVGPHRDDFGLILDGKRASDFGSEGQQRSMVLSLRLAQLAYFRARSGVEPILLADDVLGELDTRRRERFWASLGEKRQVIATGTRLPEAELGSWQIFNVRQGHFSPFTENPA